MCCWILYLCFPGVLTLLFSFPLPIILAILLNEVRNKKVKSFVQTATYPYEIYYFSRNIEHVLHNISEDLTDDEKEDLAFEIADRYSEQPEVFLKLLYEADFSVSGTYEDTWNFIMENGNSLKRHCNMSVFFDKLGIKQI